MANGTNPYFKQRNVLNNLSLDTPLYKYIPLKYIKLMLRNNKLVVGKLSDWEDTYERFLFKEIFELQDGRGVSAFEISEGIFGQCWTELEESDAMWRIYSKTPKDNGGSIDDVAVRLKTTAQKVYDTIYTEDNCMATTFIGKVIYWEDKEISEWIQNASFRPSDMNATFSSSCFIKRKPFEHEHEVRVIINTPSDDPRKALPRLNFDIVANDFIDELAIDPRLDATTVQQITAELTGVGADATKITQSQLYTFKPYTANQHIVL